MELKDKVWCRDYAAPKAGSDQNKVVNLFFFS